MNAIKTIGAAAILFGLAAATITFPALAGTTAIHHLGPAKVGATAPGWTLSDTAGVTHSLSDYAGKIVVLEWTNHQCPYVQKHYRTGNMQSLQEFATSHGAVWLSVVSSGKGRQGYVTAAEGQKISEALHSKATAKLLDTEGLVGRAYGAQTTPDIMIVDKNGTLVYSGGIDDTPTPDDEDLKTAHNYVKAALQDLFAGRSVKVSTSQPYGCAIKFASR